jgi:hypothetical protein
MSSVLIRTLLIGLIITTLPACFIFRSSNGSSANLPASIEAIDTDYEAKLQELVADSLTKLNRHTSANDAELIFRKPYYFKEYVAYPDGITGYSTDIRGSESLTTPYTAQIRLKKQRFVTKFDKKRNRAQQDEEFFATSGNETLSFELRNGRWREVGTLFVAEETDVRLRESASAARFEDTDSFETLSKPWYKKILFWRD